MKREFQAYARLLLPGKSRNVRVLIFGQGRTGSTLLEDLLSSTGHFVKHGEVLGKRACWVTFPSAYLKGRARALSDRNFICHVKPQHLGLDRRTAGAHRVDLRSFLRSLHADGWTIIHIRRSNAVRQFISELMAVNRGGYHKRDDFAETIKLPVEPLRLLKSIEMKQKRNREEAVALEGIPVIDVEYERDLKELDTHQATVDRILNALSLERRPAQSNLRKINVRPLSEIISNFDDLLVSFRERGMADLLDEESGQPFDTERKIVHLRTETAPG